MQWSWSLFIYIRPAHPSLSSLSVCLGLLRHGNSRKWKPRWRLYLHLHLHLIVLCLFGFHLCLELAQKGYILGEMMVRNRCRWRCRWMPLWVHSQMPLFVTCELLASFMPRNIPCSADPIIIILIIYSSIYVCSLVTLVDLPNHLCKFLLQAYERTVQTTDPSTNYYGVASCKIMRTHSPNVFMGLLKAKISPCLFSYSLA